MQPPNSIRLPTGYFPVVKDIWPGEIFLIVIGPNVHQETKDRYQSDLRTWAKENGIEVLELAWKSGSPNETRLAQTNMRDNARRTQISRIVFYECPKYSNVHEEYADIIFKLRQAAGPSLNVELGKFRRPGEEDLSRRFSPMVNYTRRIDFPESFDS